MSELWLLNPAKGKKKMAVRRKRRVRSKRKRTFGFMAAPKRRRKRRVYAANPVRRKRRRSVISRRRSYHHNPPAIKSIVNDLGWGAAGFMSTKIVGNLASPMLTGIGGDNALMRIGVKVGVAYVTAWGLSSFFGSKVFAPAMIGGSIEAIQDVVKTYVAPSFPMLASNYEPLESYYEPRYRALPAARGMADYMGDGLSPDHDAVV